MERTKSKDTTAKFEALEENLDSLFYEILKGCRDDLSEADEYVATVLSNIENAERGIEIYGSLYSDALKTKGAARTRQIQFLNVFKDRVTKKEDIVSKKKDDKKDDNFPDSSKLNEWLKETEEEERKQKKIKKVSKKNSQEDEVVQIKDIEDEEDFDEDIEID